jgi:hypothetical protein
MYFHPKTNHIHYEAIIVEKHLARFHLDSSLAILYPVEID